MPDATESRWGECPRCQEVNSQRAICCSKCGARLPWAAATSAAKPGVKTSAAASAAAFAKGMSGPQNKSQAELEAIMNGAQNTLQEKAEAWKPVGTKNKDTEPKEKKKRGGAEVSDWKQEFDFWETANNPRVKIVAILLLLLLLGGGLRATIFKPAPAYHVAAVSGEDPSLGAAVVSAGNDFVATDGSSSPSAPAAPSGSGGGGSVATSPPRSIIYRVEGSSTQTTIEFANERGIDKRSINSLPWSMQCTLPSGHAASVAARVKGQGGVTISIEVDGQVVSRKSGGGADQVIVCKGMV